MIVSNEVEVKWNGKNKKHYVDKGYVFTKMKETFIVKVEHLTPMSRSKVVVKCDYCGIEKIKEYFKIVHRRKKSNLEKDCCANCSPKKQKELSLIKNGVSHPAKLQTTKDRRKKTCLEKYGFEYAVQSPQVKDKCVSNSMKKYGVSNHTKTKEYREKYSKEKSPHWKGGSNHGRNERNTLEYRVWRNGVYAKTNYTCVCCGGKSKKGKSVELNAHHIENWKTHEDKRYDVNNGVALCKKCHTKFHSIYGRENNDLEQLERFISSHGKDVC